MLRVYLGNVSCNYQIILPYSCATLKAYANQEPSIKMNVDWQQPFLSLAIDGIQKMFERVVEPDILALSCYLWNFKRTIKLTRLVKEKYPKCLILTGGPYVPNYGKNRFKNFPYTDVLIHGEGEITFQEILLQILSGDFNWRKVQGITFKEGKEEITTSNSGKLIPGDIDYPSPYLLGYLEENERELESRNIEKTCILETNRGCSHVNAKCIYCYGGNSHIGFRLFDWDRVCKEIEYIGPRMDNVIFTDSNFGALPRDIEIIRKIEEQISQHKKIKYCHVTHSKNTDEKTNDRLIEITKILESRNSFKEGVSLSFQTLSRKASKSFITKFSEIQGILNAKGAIHTVELLVGLPEETLDSILDLCETILDGFPLDIKCYGLTKTPNAKLNTKAVRNKYDINTRTVCIYEGIEEDENEFMEQVISTKDFPKDQMEWFLKFRDMLQILHFGKWSYFIFEFLKKEYGIRRVDLYRELAADDENTVVRKYFKSWYIKNWNSGNFVAFKGPIIPYDIKWEDVYFQKNTFHWLCISLERELFYLDLKQFLKKRIKWNSKLEDLFKFQREAMVTFDFDVNLQESLLYKFNWFEHFHGNEPLIERDNHISYKTKLNPRDPKDFFKIAGGDNQYFHKVNCFIHRSAEIKYKTNEVIVYKSDSTTGLSIKKGTLKCE